MRNKRLIEGVPIFYAIFFLILAYCQILQLRKENVNYVLNDEIINSCMLFSIILILYLLKKNTWHLVFAFAIVFSFLGYLSFSSTEKYINLGFGEINLLTFSILLVYLICNYSFIIDVVKNYPKVK